MEVNTAGRPTWFGYGFFVRLWRVLLWTPHSATASSRVYPSSSTALIACRISLLFFVIVRTNEITHRRIQLWKDQEISVRSLNGSEKHYIAFWLTNWLLVLLKQWVWSVRFWSGITFDHTYVAYVLFVFWRVNCSCFLQQRFIGIRWCLPIQIDLPRPCLY